uniref:Ig-like domain-containing protein n=1 Tax=Erpetoichthys calabaricus TaxID=27687 RepID=A0A8C4XC36_ERPCA
FFNYFKFLVIFFFTGVILTDFLHLQTVRAQLGDSLSLECSIKPSYQYTLFWFKQTPGEAPQNIAFWSGNFNDDIYYNDKFNQSGRYQVKKSINFFSLSIISLEITDMGTYYCGVVRQRNILFGNGTEICLTNVILADFLHLQTVRAQLGDSLSLECSIKPSYQYTLFWFKQSPGEAPQNIAFWSGNFNDDIHYDDKFNRSERYQVKKSINFFSLSIISLEITDMGTYYCGVVRQRNILFGNGTEICLKSNLDSLRRQGKTPKKKSCREKMEETFEKAVQREIPF